MYKTFNLLYIRAGRSDERVSSCKQERKKALSIADILFFFSSRPIK